MLSRSTILLGLFLRDQGATESISNLSRFFIRLLDDERDIAAESVLVDESFDL